MARASKLYNTTQWSQSFKQLTGIATVIADDCPQVVLENNHLQTCQSRLSHLLPALPRNESYRQAATYHCCPQGTVKVVVQHADRVDPDDPSTTHVPPSTPFDSQETRLVDDTEFLHQIDTTKIVPSATKSTPNIKYSDKVPAQCIASWVTLRTHKAAIVQPVNLDII